MEDLYKEELRKDTARLTAHAASWWTR